MGDVGNLSLSSEAYFYRMEITHFYTCAIPRHWTKAEEKIIIEAGKQFMMKIPKEQRKEKEDLRFELMVNALSAKGYSRSKDDCSTHYLLLAKKYCHNPPTPPKKQHEGGTDEPSQQKFSLPENEAKSNDENEKKQIQNMTNSNISEDLKDEKISSGGGRVATELNKKVNKTSKNIKNIDVKCKNHQSNTKIHRELESPLKENIKYKQLQNEIKVQNQIPDQSGTPMSSKESLGAQNHKIKCKSVDSKKTNNTRKNRSTDRTSNCNNNGDPSLTGLKKTIGPYKSHNYEVAGANNPFLEENHEGKPSRPKRVRRPKKLKYSDSVSKDEPAFENATTAEPGPSHESSPGKPLANNLETTEAYLQPIEERSMVMQNLNECIESVVRGAEEIEPAQGASIKKADSQRKNKSNESMSNNSDTPGKNNTEEKYIPLKKSERQKKRKSVETISNENNESDTTNANGESELTNPKTNIYNERISNYDSRKRNIEETSYELEKMSRTRKRKSTNLLSNNNNENEKPIIEETSSELRKVALPRKRKSVDTSNDDHESANLNNEETINVKTMVNTRNKKSTDHILNDDHGTAKNIIEETTNKIEHPKTSKYSDKILNGDIETTKHNFEEKSTELKQMSGTIKRKASDMLSNSDNETSNPTTEEISTESVQIGSPIKRKITHIITIDDNKTPKPTIEATQFKKMGRPRRITSTDTISNDGNETAKPEETFTKLVKKLGRKKKNKSTDGILNYDNETAKLEESSHIHETIKHSLGSLTRGDGGIELEKDISIEKKDNIIIESTIKRISNHSTGGKFKEKDTSTHQNNKKQEKVLNNKKVNMQNEECYTQNCNGRQLISNENGLLSNVEQNAEKNSGGIMINANEHQMQDKQSDDISDLSNSDIQIRERLGNDMLKRKKRSSGTDNTYAKFSSNINLEENASNSSEKRKSNSEPSQLKLTMMCKCNIINCSCNSESVIEPNSNALEAKNDVSIAEDIDELYDVLGQDVSPKPINRSSSRLREITTSGLSENDSDISLHTAKTRDQDSRLLVRAPYQSRYYLEEEAVDPTSLDLNGIPRTNGDMVELFRNPDCPEFTDLETEGSPREFTEEDDTSLNKERDSSSPKLMKNTLIDQQDLFKRLEANEELTKLLQTKLEKVERDNKAKGKKLQKIERENKANEKKIDRLLNKYKAVKGKIFAIAKTSGFRLK